MYRSMIKMYYRAVHVAVIVYDVSNLESFLSVKRWMSDIEEKQTGSLRKCIYFIVGNKSDMKSVVEASEIKLMFEGREDINYMEVSAKTGENIDLLFE